VRGVTLLSIPRRDIVRLRLTEGLTTERPLVALVCGALATIGGLSVTFYWVRALIAGTVNTVMPFGMAFLLIIGPWLFLRARRRGPILLVETRAGVRKLDLDAIPTADERVAFVTAVRADGLEIADEVGLPTAAARPRG